MVASIKWKNGDVTDYEIKRERYITCRYNGEVKTVIDIEPHFPCDIHDEVLSMIINAIERAPRDQVMQIMYRR